MSDGRTPALLGDGEGNYRVMVVGNSGTGKSTLSAALAKELHVPYVALDRLNWNPGWKETPAEDLKVLVQKTMDENSRGWVIDGNYSRKIGPIVQDSATDIIWLDPPLALSFPRIFVRTMRRYFGWEDPCSPGCGEDDLKGVFFSKNSILWWCLIQHSSVRRRCGQMMSSIGIGMGSDVAARRMRRIGGWGGELKAWWRAVELLTRDKRL